MKRIVFFAATLLCLCACRHSTTSTTNAEKDESVRYAQKKDDEGNVRWKIYIKGVPKGEYLQGADIYGRGSGKSIDTIDFVTYLHADESDVQKYEVIE